MANVTAHKCQQPHCNTWVAPRHRFCRKHRPPAGWAISAAVRDEERGGSFLDEPHAEQPTALFKDFSGPERG